jgi:hypothetical protein
VSTLIRGYPPVLGAMLLVDGVLTVILGGDATVSLGEVVAYLLLPPLAMFLLTRFTGGRRPNAVTIGAGVAGAAVLFAALFLGGGVHLVTLPGWVLALVGLVLLAVAVLLMRRSAGPAAHPVPPPLSPSERDGNEDRDEREYPDHDDYGSRSGDYGRAAESEWPPARRDDDDPAPPAYPAARSADGTVTGLPPVAPSHAAGPAEAEWPPRRDPVGAGPTWSDGARSDWSTVDRSPYEADAAPPPYAGEAPPEARPTWSDGPADREWPPTSPAPADREWPPRGDSGSDPDGGAQRSWFDTDEAQPAQPAEPAWSPDPPDHEWPPASGGRRSRHPDQ